ncbi:MAG: type IV pilus assembly protein PilM, partial [bacterium]|nr:type IV pilus assembly protein PilM [bacterium]
MQIKLFKKKAKPSLGIDIGTASIKVVQLKKEEEKFKLETYGQISTIGYLERLNDTFQSTSLKTLEVVAREMLRVVLEKAEVTVKNAVMSIPVFSSFVSIIEMPFMGEKELARAIQFEARRYVPIPLPEVILDWRVIEIGMIKNDFSPRPFKGKRVLLIAVPIEVVNKYLRIADDLGLGVVALELESFSVARSLMSNDKSSVCILDVGVRASSFTIVDKGIVQMSHSLDIGGGEMTRTLATGLGIASERAEEFKMTYGFDHEAEKQNQTEVRDLLNVPISRIVDEIERMINSYQFKTGRKVEKIILNGGSSRLRGLIGYIGEKLDIKTIVANPWSSAIYPTVLQNTLNEIG